MNFFYSKIQVGRIIGNVMMLAAVFVLGYIYYPFLRVYFFSGDVVVNKTPSQISEITIPSINAQATVIENVDPYSPSKYNEALKNGVAHAEGSSLPGEGGTVYLFAHSSDNPLRIGRYNTAFFRLGELTLGDEIIIDHGGSRHFYKVTGEKEVSPNEIAYLTEDSGDKLILQTCAPLGTSLRRLLVFAEPVEDRS